MFEVLSPATEAYDRTEKRLHYQRIEALDTYVLVSQEERQLEVWHRHGDAWSQRFVGPGERTELESIGCTLDVDELYDTAGV